MRSIKKTRNFRKYNNVKRGGSFFIGKKKTRTRRANNTPSKEQQIANLNQLMNKIKIDASIIRSKVKNARTPELKIIYKNNLKSKLDAYRNYKYMKTELERLLATEKLLAQQNHPANELTVMPSRLNNLKEGVPRKGFFRKITNRIPKFTNRIPKFLRRKTKKNKSRSNSNSNQRLASYGSMQNNTPTARPRPRPRPTARPTARPRPTAPELTFNDYNAMTIEQLNDLLSNSNSNSPNDEELLARFQEEELEGLVGGGYRRKNTRKRRRHRNKRARKSVRCSSK